MDKSNALTQSEHTLVIRQTRLVQVSLEKLPVREVPYEVVLIYSVELY